MAGDPELRKLIEKIVTNPRAALRVMTGMTDVVKELASELNLQINEEQAKDVSRSLLVSRLADIAWPDSSATSFEIQVYREPELP